MDEDFSDLVEEKVEDTSTTLEPKHAGSVIEYFSDQKAMMTFLKRTRAVPLEFIQECVVDQGYAAVLWQFRSAVLNGDLNAAKALKLWLDWAEQRIARPKKNKVKMIKNPATAGFLPRVPSTEDV